MADIEVVVVGAGVVGLACARALALAGHEVVVVEAEGGIGRGISSRSSEVIHRGLYYPAGSLKAVHCLRGRTLLYRYCGERGIAHRRCGKLVVATARSQLPALDALHATAAANGVDDLLRLDADQALELEPALRCVGALSSPGSGIVDSHALMLSLQGDLEATGGACVFNTRVERARCIGDGIVVDTRDGADAGLLSLHCRWLVNAAGLGAPALGARMQGFPARQVPPLYLAKGNYFALAGHSPFRQMIYPLPGQAGLGVHLTLDMQGQARFGPDVQWVEHEDYRVDPRRGDAFADAIRRYWPGLAQDALQPAYAGIRPKLVGPGQDSADFRILGPRDHGVAGVVQLFGIESPGLTASLSIGAHVAALVGPAGGPGPRAGGALASVATGEA